MDEESTGRVKSRRSRKKQDFLYTKHAPSFRRFSPGIFTVYCAGCSLMLGFSLLDQSESVRTALSFAEISTCHRRDHHNTSVGIYGLDSFCVSEQQISELIFKHRTNDRNAEILVRGKVWVTSKE